MQEDAKKFAEECDAVDLKRGQNIFYNITTLQEDTVERLDDIVRLWKVDSQSLQVSKTEHYTVTVTITLTANTHTHTHSQTCTLVNHYSGR